MAKILFYQTVWWESLGIMSISNILKKNGHYSRIFFGNKKKFLKVIKEFKPDLIGFSCTSAQISEVLRVSDYLKVNKVPAPIILGGIHPTIYPDVINHYSIDYICRGDGEYTVLELLTAIGQKSTDFQNIKGLYYKKNGNVCRNPLRPLTRNLDHLGFPDRSVYYNRYRFFRDSPFKTFMQSRGCPYQCSFCTNHILHELYKGSGPIMRYRSAGSLIDEITSVRDTYGIKFVFFQDEIFNLQKKRFVTLLELYKKKVRIPFWCKIRVDRVNSETAKQLHEANCSVVEIGIETGNKCLRDDVLHKNLNDFAIVEAVEILKKCRINIRVNNLFGLLGETLEDALSTIEFTRKLKPHYLSASIFQPYPGLQLTTEALKQNIIPAIDFNNMPPHCNRESLLKQKDIKKVCNLHKFSYLIIKMPFLKPVIKNLINLPPNFLFNYIHDISYGIMNFLQYRRCAHVKLTRFIEEGLKNYKSL